MQTEFTETQISDHDFARWLRDRGAIDNYKSAGRSVMWANESGEVVAIAFYDNAACTRKTWLKDKESTS